MKSEKRGRGDPQYNQVVRNGQERHYSESRGVAAVRRQSAEESKSGMRLPQRRGERDQPLGPCPIIRRASAYWCEIRARIHMNSLEVTAHLTTVASPLADLSPGAFIVKGSAQRGRSPCLWVQVIPPTPVKFPPKTTKRAGQDPLGGTPPRSRFFPISRSEELGAGG